VPYSALPEPTVLPLPRLQAACRNERDPDSAGYCKRANDGIKRMRSPPSLYDPRLLSEAAEWADEPLRAQAMQSPHEAHLPQVRHVLKTHARKTRQPYVEHLFWNWFHA